MLLNNITKPETVSPRNYEININVNFGNEGNLNIDNDHQKHNVKPVKMTRKKVGFDWNDHYLEGLRIHGNIDDAESHADDMKRKITGRI